MVVGVDNALIKYKTTTQVLPRVFGLWPQTTNNKVDVIK